MLHSFSSDDASERNIWKTTHVDHRLTPPPFDVSTRCIVQGGYAEPISRAEVQIAELGLAEARRIGQDGLEYVPQVFG